MMYANRKEEEVSASLTYPYWYGKPLRVRPWWLRSTSMHDEWKLNWHVTYLIDSRFSTAGRPGRGWFTSGFPVFAPYYPMPSPQLWQNEIPEPYYSSFWWP